MERKLYSFIPNGISKTKLEERWKCILYFFISFLVSVVGVICGNSKKELENSKK